MVDDLYDVIIIGGGPAGLSAAQYAARAKLKTIVLDKSPTAGALAYTGRIENYPGLKDAVSGKALLDTFRAQAISFGAEYVEMPVVGVKLEAEIKEVSGKDKTYLGKTVIVATGSVSRKPSIPGEKEMLGRGVSYCATCDAAFFRSQRVCVVGDSDDALKEAEVLVRYAKSVYLIAPSKLPPLPESLAKVTLLENSQVLSITGGDVVIGIRVKSNDTGAEREMPMDGVFIYLYGALPSVAFLGESADRGAKSCLLTHQTTETSLPGVYAAGDVTCSEVRQVVVSAAYGCIAALSAEKYLRNRKVGRYDWARE